MSTQSLGAQNMVMVTKSSFGLYTLDAAAEYLGVSYTTVLDAVKKGYMPERHANKLLDMGNLVMLPIDEPPLGRSSASTRTAPSKRSCGVISFKRSRKLRLASSPRRWTGKQPLPCHLHRCSACFASSRMVWLGPRTRIPAS